MSDVFISYAREDLDIAKRISDALSTVGLSVFWDRTVPAGKPWWQYIGRELAKADCVVVLWSKNSVDSHWVQEEADRGLRRDVLVPVLIEDIQPPLGFGNVQCADLLEWDGTEEAAQFQQVLSAIKGLIGGAIPIRQFAKPMPVTYAKTPELVPTLNTLEANYWVTELALSPNEKLLAWVCYNGPGQVVRLADGMSLHEFTGSSVAFSADGTMLAVGGAFGIQLLEPETGKELQKRFGGVSDCVNVKFSSDGKWLAAARGMHHRVDLWRVPNSEPEYQLPHEGYVVCVAFSPGGTALASASRDNLARIWRVRDGKLLHTLEGHTDKDVNCVDFSPDGTVVASGGTDETVRLWRSSEGSLLRVLKTTGRVGSVTFSPDGVILATTSIPNSNDVQLWSVADGVLLHTIEAHNDIVSHVMFSPDGQMLLSGSRDGTVKLWSLAGLD